MRCFVCGEALRSARDPFRALGVLGALRGVGCRRRKIPLSPPEAFLLL